MMKRIVNYRFRVRRLLTMLVVRTPLPPARSIHVYVARALARSVAQAGGSAKQPDQQRRYRRSVTLTAGAKGLLDFEVSVDLTCASKIW